MLEGFCRHCGKELTRKRFGKRLEDLGVFSRRKFCDRSCMASAYEGQIKNLTPQNSRRQSAKHRASKCTDCGKTRGLLHNHHMNQNPSVNVESNLETLCVRCHMMRHSPNCDPTTGQRLPCLYCAAPSRKNRMCFTHLSRLKRHGHPLAKKVRTKSGWILKLPDGSEYTPSR